MSERIIRNVIHRKDEIRIADWLREHKDDLHERRPPFTGVARTLTELLNENREDKDKIVVTRDNVKGIARDLEILWKPAIPKRPATTPKVKKPRDADKQQGYRERFNSRTGSLEARMTRLEAMVNQLFTGLNMPIPPAAPRPSEIEPQPARSYMPVEGEPAGNILDQIRQQNLRAVPAGGS